MAKQSGLLVLWVGLSVAACAGGPDTGSLTTGSVLPSLPSLPSAGGLLPSFGDPSAPGRLQRVSGNLYRLPASDHRITDSIERENYDMLRAAEATRSVGGTHFVIVTLNGPSNGAPFSGGGAVVAGGILLRVITVSRASEPPVGAVSADEILHFLGPKFGHEPPPGLPANPDFPAGPAAPQQPPQLRGT